MENGWYLVTADALVLADARQAITITVKCDGTEVVNASSPTTPDNNATPFA